MENILEIKNLKKSYYNETRELLVIDKFSLKVRNGEFMGIVGTSGCGKSTLLSILNGLENKTDGEIILNDNMKLGYMLQSDTLFPWLNILDNSLLGLKIKKELTEEKKNKCIKMLDTYGLKDFKKAFPNSLSGGMKQRVALIRTLATAPDILLLDEAFSALDYQTRLAVSDDVYNIIKEEKKTAIMITHDIAEAISMCDRVVVLTNRPCSVKRIYEIKLTDKTTPINNRKCKEFSYYYDKIWKDLDVHV